MGYFILIFQIHIFFIGVDPKGTFKIPIPIAGALLNVAIYLVDAGHKAWNGEAGETFSILTDIKQYST